LKQWAVLTLCCFLSCSGRAFAVDPGLDWKTIESEHLYVHFAEGNKAIAERVLVIAEAAHQRLTEELNWQPVEKTHIILSDQTDQPNGYATPIFFNRTVLFLAPPSSVNTLEDFDDWLTTLIVHEYTHIVHLDKSAGSPEYLRNIFGRLVFLFPNIFQPAWVIEGLATQKETDPEHGTGRGQSTLFASMMREELANGLQPISHVNLPVRTWPAGTTRYLYGVYFMNFIAERYGEEQLQAWIEEYSDNLLPFFINTNARQTLGKNLTPLWQEFEQWLKQKFQPQIDAIRSRGVKAGKQISTGAYRTNSLHAFATEDGDELYYVSDSGDENATLMHVDAEGKTHALINLNNVVNLDVHPQSGLLLTQNEFCNNYTIYSDIYSYDKRSNELKRLTECGRYLYASWFPDGKQIAAVHHEATRFELQLLDEDAQLEDVLWRGDNGEIIGQIDVSPDGKKIVASVWRKGNGWNIELFDLAGQKWTPITRGVSIAANPQYNPAGEILFSLEADGVYNLYRYSPATEKVEQLTNLIGGAFQSSQASPDGPIYYAGYSAQGYAIYRLDDVTAFSPAPPFKDDRLQLIDYTVMSHQQKDYSALSNMYPRWWFPAWVFTDQRSEFGITTAGSDALGIHNYLATASYDFDLDEPAARLVYAYANRFYLFARSENEIYLDADGELNRVARRSRASAVLAFPDYYIQQQTNLLFAVSYDKRSDEQLAAGAMPVDDFEDNLLGIAWLYNSARIYPLSISPNDGMNLRLVAEDSDTLSSDYSGQVYSLYWRQYIRTGRESVFALRFLQGWGTGQPQHFQLGGVYSNNDIAGLLFGDSSDPVFGERQYALRGYNEGLPQLRGRRAQLLSGEWRFPIQRIERGIMAPPAGLMQWSGAVFAETGSAYQDSPEKYYTSAGLEVNADVDLFYGAVFQMSAGLAHGFDREIGDNLAYLRIGRSF
jgi:Tol biopolymer transport system component